MALSDWWARLRQRPARRPKRARCVLRLEPLDAVEGPPLALRFGVLEILGQKLQVQAERREVVFDFVNEAPG